MQKKKKSFENAKEPATHIMCTSVFIRRKKVESQKNAAEEEKEPLHPPDSGQVVGYKVRRDISTAKM